MCPDNKSISPAEFPLALFMLGMPLTLAAYSLSGIIAPSNLADIIMTGLAVIGLLAEPFRNDDHHVVPLWIKAGIPGILISWISFSSFPPLAMPLVDYLPYIMEARPLIYLMVAILWTTMFGIPTPDQISFWAFWLALLICIEFGFGFFVHGLAIEPNIFGHYTLTGPAMLAGLCATLHTQNRIIRFVIICGIFCTLTRDIALTAVALLLVFGPKGLIRKMLLVMGLFFFTYISLIPQDMTMLNRNDLPQYWIWFSCLELLARNPALLLTGFPFSIPLPLSIPASLWNIWHEQHFVWTDQGIHLFHVTPFWLHIIIAWGLGGVCATVAAMTVLYRKYPSAMMAGLITIIAMTGLFSPLLYSSPSATVLFCSFLSATKPELRSFKFE